MVADDKLAAIKVILDEYLDGWDDDECEGDWDNDPCFSVAFQVAEVMRGE